jgi:hypothetical protein
MNKLKVLGVLMVVLFALAGVDSVSASAAVAFHSEVTETFIFGEQEGENIFHRASGNVKCKSATFTQNNIMGTGSGTNFTFPDVTVSEGYSVCTAFRQAATIDINGGTYTITPISTTSGTIVIIQGSGGAITVTVPTGNCNVTIAGQTPTGSVDLADTGTGSTEFVKMTATVTGIAYSVVSTNGKKEGESTTCGIVGAHMGGEYTGVVNEKGYTTSAHTTQVGIKVE